VELRGFEPMVIAGAVGLELFLPSPVNSRSRLVARAFSIAIDALASVALFWRRSQASLRAPSNPGRRMTLQATQPRRTVPSTKLWQSQRQSRARKCPPGA
jgi:hypothetical protein